MSFTCLRPFALGAIVAAALWPASGALAQGGQPTSVLAEPVRRETVQDQRRVTGELRAHRRSRVATREAGVVVELPVRQGMAVAEGDVLARLDSRRLVLLKQELEADLAGNEAQVNEREALLEWRDRDLELLTSSFERGGANPKELADAKSQAAVATALLLHAKRQVEVITARLALVDERLEDTVIKAPFDGVVVAHEVELGEWVDEGGAVAELVSTDHVEVWLEVPQRFLEAVTAREAEISVHVEATGKSITSRQKRVIPLVDPRARSFYVVVDVTGDAAAGLAPGMSVMGWVPTGDRGEHLLISRNAILRNEAGPFVYVARGGTGEMPAQAVPVQVRELFPVGSRTVIDDGAIREGELIVIEGNERLSPMMPVIPIVQGPDTPGPTAGSQATGQRGGR